MFVDTRSKLAFELSISSPQRINRQSLTNALSKYSLGSASDNSGGAICLFTCLTIDALNLCTGAESLKLCYRFLGKVVELCLG